MVKGGLDVHIDASIISDIIVAGNTLRIEVGDRAAAIRKVCADMTEAEYLNGGDGEIIKQAFIDISAGYTQIEESLAKITTELDKRLSVILKMNKGNTTATAQDEAAKAKKRMGVLKKS